MRKVLIIDDVHPLLPQGLKALGYEVHEHPGMRRPQLIEQIGAYDGLVVRTGAVIDKGVLSQAGRLRFIARAGAGLDNIDTVFCHDRGITCFNAGEANADAVGEHTIGLMLALFAKIVKADAEVRNRIWNRDDNRGTGLQGKTVGIIGYGNTGKAVARKLSGFEVKVIAYDKFLVNFTDAWASEATMQQIFAEADVVSFHIPLDDGTDGMVNAEYLRQFSKSIWLINAARGRICRLKDIADAVQSGSILGAGLDVLENENLAGMNEEQETAFRFLASSNRVVFTPHVAGWTLESYRGISQVLLQKIAGLQGPDKF